MASVENNVNIEAIIQAYHEVIARDIENFEMVVHEESSKLVPVETSLLRTAGYFSVVETGPTIISATIGYSIPFLNPITRRNTWKGSVFDYANIQHNHPSYGTHYLQVPFDQQSEKFVEIIEKDIMSCFNR